MRFEKNNLKFIFPILLAVMAYSLGVSGMRSLAAQENQAAAQAALKGTWKSVCMNLGSNVFITIKSTYDGAGNSKDKVVYFSDPGCSTPTGLVKANSSVSYKVGRQFDVGSRKAYEIDSSIQSWQLSQNGSVIKSGNGVATQYDIFSIEGNKLYTSGLTRGQRGPITSPAGRPRTLDTANYFTKQ